jgi:hypothetical protein
MLTEIFAVHSNNLPSCAEVVLNFCNQICKDLISEFLFPNFIPITTIAYLCTTVSKTKIPGCQVVLSVIFYLRVNTIAGFS